MAGKLAGSSAPPYVVLSTGLLQCPPHMKAAFQSQASKTQGRSCFNHCDLALEVTQRHLHNIHWSQRPFFGGGNCVGAWIPEGKDL